MLARAAPPAGLALTVGRKTRGRNSVARGFFTYGIAVDKVFAPVMILKTEGPPVKTSSSSSPTTPSLLFAVCSLGGFIVVVVVVDGVVVVSSWM